MTSEPPAGVIGPVWFERPIPAALVAEVEARTSILGPGTLSPDDPYLELADARGAVVSIHEYTADVLDRAPHLQVVCRTGIGYDRVDVAAATARGIAVCNTPDGPTVPTAEHAIALMLAAAKRLKAAEAALRSGGLDFFHSHYSMELDGKTLGLIGFGRIARRVAVAAGALGMAILAYDPHVDSSSFPSHVERAATLVGLLGGADVVSLHVPLTAETAGMIGGSEIRSMRRGSILVNTARGGLVDMAALLTGLDDGHLFAAGLDVTDPEPLPPDHPALRREDIIVTPHVASATVEGRTRIFRTAMDQVMAVIEGRRPEHLVNPEVWDRARAQAGR